MSSSLGCPVCVYLIGGGGVGWGVGGGDGAGVIVAPFHIARTVSHLLPSRRDFLPRLYDGDGASHLSAFRMRRTI